MGYGLFQYFTVSYIICERGKCMLFNNNEIDFNMSFFEVPGSDFNLEVNRGKFVAPEEGFLRGNMFRDEYVPYKNLTYFKLVPTSDREKKLFKVMEYSFAINDLNLYLDLHPEDEEAYRIFQNFVEQKEKAKKEFTRSYGPLVVTDDEFKTYEWMKNPWPWDNDGGSMYV